MFSDQYKITWEQVTALSLLRARPVNVLQPRLASDFAPLLWAKASAPGVNWIVKSSCAGSRPNRLFTAGACLPSSPST